MARQQKIITRQRMGYGSLLFHWTMILCTCGLWTPVYLSARRKRSSVTYGPVPVQQQPAPQQQWAPPPSAGPGWSQPQQQQVTPWPPQQRPYGQPRHPDQQPPANWPPTR